MRFAVPALLAVAAVLPCADLPEEKEIIDNRPVVVWNYKERTIGVKADADVQSRELWYRSFAAAGWSAWQKHGQGFAKDAPITWAPTEGHWQVYVRKILTSGLSSPEPILDTKAHGEFIIDRSAPVVSIGFPLSKAMLRGGDHYAIKWEVADPHLRSAPITILFSRDGKSAGEVVAANIPNSGSYDWVVPRDMTTSGVLRIEATDKAGNTGFAESSAILVDSIKPMGKVLEPAISARAELNLALDVRDEGPAGLASAQLWVSQDDGTTWTQGPVVGDFKQVAWKAPADGKFRLAVTAVDKSGNASPAPKGKGDGQFVVTVDTAAPTVLLSSVIGIIPADQATPGTKRDFKPGDRVQVPFAIKDANLAPSTVAVQFQADPTKPWQDLARGLPADQAFRFEVPVVETKQARIKVSAVDLAGNLGESVSTETFAIQTTVVEEVIEIK